MKQIFWVLLIAIFFIGCANSKTFKKDGKDLYVPTYGLFNQHNHVEGVRYEVSTGNIIWSIILSETIVIPVWLIGWELYEPVICEVCQN